MRKRNILLIVILPTLICLIFIVIGILTLIRNENFKKNSIEITARIDEIRVSRDTGGEYHYTVYVSYTYDGVEYNMIRLREYSSSMTEGNSIRLRCNKSNPRDVRDEQTTNFLGIIFIAVGTFVMVIFALILLVIGKSLKVQDNRIEGYKFNKTVDYYGNGNYNGSTDYYGNGNYNDSTDYYGNDKDKSDDSKKDDIWNF